MTTEELDYYKCSNNSSELSGVEEDVANLYTLSSENYYCLNNTDSIELKGTQNAKTRKVLLVRALKCDSSVVTCTENSILDSIVVEIYMKTNFIKYEDLKDPFNSHIIKAFDSLVTSRVATFK